MCSQTNKNTETCAYCGKPIAAGQTGTVMSDGTLHHLCYHSRMVQFEVIHKFFSGKCDEWQAMRELGLSQQYSERTARFVLNQIGLLYIDNLYIWEQESDKSK